MVGVRLPLGHVVEHLVALGSEGTARSGGGGDNFHLFYAASPAILLEHPRKHRDDQTLPEFLQWNRF